MLLCAGGMLFAFALFKNAVPDFVLWGVEILLLLSMFFSRHTHTHGGMLSMDACAQKSRFFTWHAGGKFLFAVGMLFGCICADSLLLSAVVFLLMTLLTVAAGGVPLHEYIAYLKLPAGFVLLGGLTILFQFLPTPGGLIDIPLFGQYLSVTPESRMEALILTGKAIAAVSCLYFASLSTPMGELIGFFRRIHLPKIIIELMYLIYRYIFILLEAHRTMQDAAESRLGYRDMGTTFRTYPKLAANLMVLSFRKASRSFDAMESRCYEGDVCFLEQDKPLAAKQLVCFAGCVVIAVGVCLAERMIG